VTDPAATGPAVDELAGALDELARQEDFSGVVRIERAGTVEVDAAYGWAHRGWRIANTPETRFALASGNKGFTALAVMSLVEDGTLSLTTTARSILGDDLPLIDDRVTVEHLLGHRSGIGDYLDESAGHDIDDYAMPVPVHQLVTTEDFLVALDGYPTSFPPDDRFAYNNGGYMVLALLAERASGTSYHDLVEERVCRPAAMRDTAFLRSDELPGGVALGYLGVESVSRTNVFHLPVRGNGDGGIYSTTADVSAFWSALFAGRIVANDTVAKMIRPRSDYPEEDRRYGLGFWMFDAGDAVFLEGYDAGVSFRTVHDPSSALTWTVISNTSEGAWPICVLLKELL
jgi:CubicO group peptidase (beta-lactamase class C family)